MLVAALFGLLGLTTLSANAATPPTTLLPEQSLGVDQQLVSDNGLYRLLLQGDGNLVVYAKAGTSEKVLWNIGLTAGVKLKMQGDGNLVLRDSAGAEVFHTATYGHPGARLIMQGDGNLVIYDGARAIWDSGSVVPRTKLTKGEKLTVNQRLVSPNGDHSLVMLPDGNLVLFGPLTYRWASGTLGTGNYALMQDDGNFVVYSPANVALWWSGTEGNPGAWLNLQDDGNLVVYNAAGAPKFNTGPYVSFRLRADEKLRPGTELRSPNGLHNLAMLADGNLVLFGPNSYRWASGTRGTGNYALMQGDGNLVVYSAANVALWSTRTAGNPGAWLNIQDDGNMVVYAAGGAVKFETGIYVPPPPPTPPPPANCNAVTGPVSAASTTRVGGITVHKCLAASLSNLLAAANGAGVALSGGGYRSAEQQIATRRNNCGTTYYDIWQKPASQCHPPTAKPGQSMHERGLAIDFSNCTTHSTACWKWLNANARNFGLYNLPSEPWHWSTNAH